MKHHNDNMLCAIDIETSGLIAGHHEILQIAAIPLGDDYEWNKHLNFFDKYIRPNFPERIDSEAIKALKREDTSLDYEKAIISKEKIARICNEGVSQDRSIDMFLDWFERLHLKPKKRLIPVGHNLHFDMAMIRHWLGEASFNLIFDPRWRDTMIVALFWNDVDGFHGDRCKFKDAKLSTLCNVLGVENNMAHNAFDDAMATARCYGRMVKQFDLTAKVYTEDELPKVNSVASRGHERADDKWLANLPQAMKDKVVAEYLVEQQKRKVVGLPTEHSDEYLEQGMPQ